jgi:hypothetical protein
VTGQTAARTDTQRLLELARYCRAVLQAYLEGQSDDLAGLVRWIDHPPSLRGPGRATCG